VAVRLDGNGVGRVNEVSRRRARLVLGWVTVRGYTVLVGLYVTSGYAMVVHGRPKTPKNTSFLGVTQLPGVVQPLYSRGHN